MRHYTEISKEDFLSKVKEVMEHEEYPYELPSNIIKDIRKVQFDFENVTDFKETNGFADYSVGYKELKPGFHTFFVNAGGDWEFPVCFIIYWGNNQLRGYVPKDGNVWNKKEKCAYDDDDDENHDGEYNEDKMIEDILNRIKIK